MNFVHQEIFYSIKILSKAKRSKQISMDFNQLLTNDAKLLPNSKTYLNNIKNEELGK
uniref:Uncharacterized protein n=1 Tax=uncultured crenarchaeote MCG TaxID=529375 RepID=B2YI65_9CREN|nr:hypothetical protein [uncultured crenarchaeote MCG]